MKLELKHLAPYLPYQPNVLHLERNIALKVTGIYKKYNADEHFDILLLNWDLTLKSTEVKPILRPLSDLDKVDGDFATSHSICKLLGNGEDYGKVTIYHFNGEVTIEIETNSSTAGYESLDFATTQLIREELLKSHYDIFGLIESGLAIDINQTNPSPSHLIA